MLAILMMVMAAGWAASAVTPAVTAVVPPAVTATPDRPAAVKKTVKEFLKMSKRDSTFCELTGVVTKVRSYDRGKLFLDDGTGSVLIYGVVDLRPSAPNSSQPSHPDSAPSTQPGHPTADSSTQPASPDSVPSAQPGHPTATGQRARRSFRDLDVREGDTLTVRGQRFVYDGRVIEMKSGLYVRHSEGPDHQNVAMVDHLDRDPSFKGKDLAAFASWLTSQLAASGLPATVSVPIQSTPKPGAKVSTIPANPTTGSEQSATPTATPAPSSEPSATPTATPTPSSEPSAIPSGSPAQTEVGFIVGMDGTVLEPKILSHPVLSSVPSSIPSSGAAADPSSSAALAHSSGAAASSALAPSAAPVSSTSAAAIDAEILRILSRAPKWKPGVIDGRTVRVNYSLLVTY